MMRRKQTTGILTTESRDVGRGRVVDDQVRACAIETILALFSPPAFEYERTEKSSFFFCIFCLQERSVFFSRNTSLI